MDDLGGVVDGAVVFQVAEPGRDTAALVIGDVPRVEYLVGGELRSSIPEVWLRAATKVAGNPFRKNPGFGGSHLHHLLPSAPIPAPSLTVLDADALTAPAPSLGIRVRVLWRPLVAPAAAELASARALDVHSMGDRFQMVGVHTSCVAATMVEFSAYGDRPLEPPISNAMRSLPCSTVRDASAVADAAVSVSGH